jgi:DNA-binding response OmpR family regulator
MILLAEDDEDDQEFITLAFKKVSAVHDFHISSNGKEIIEYLDQLPVQHLPCLIVLDLNMPVLDGVQTLEILNTMDKYDHIPKVIFTTSDSEVDKVRCMAMGASDYLVKPYNMTEIVKSVEAMLKYCA